MAQASFLAIEGSGNQLALALAQNNKVLLRSYTEVRRHTNYVLPAIESLLQEANINFATLSAISFSAGPGSFTGLRLIASVIQAISYVHKIPVVPISTLAVIAHAFQTQAIEQAILIAQDARQVEVYWGLYQHDAAGVLQTVQADCLSTPQQLAETLTPLLLQTTPFVVGDAWSLDRMQTLSAEFQTHQPVPDANLLVQSLVDLTRCALAAGEGQSAEQALPLYLREQVVLAKKQ